MKNKKKIICILSLLIFLSIIFTSTANGKYALSRNSHLRITVEPLKNGPFSRNSHITLLSSRVRAREKHAVK